MNTEIAKISRILARTFIVPTETKKQIKGILTKLSKKDAKSLLKVLETAQEKQNDLLKQAAKSDPGFEDKLSSFIKAKYNEGIEKLKEKDEATAKKILNQLNDELS